MPLLASPNGTFSDNRDSRSQYFYVGAQYDPLSNLTLSIEAGGQYVDYYHPAIGLKANSQLQPYANMSGTYTYLPGSYVQAGFTQTQSATDVVAPIEGQVTESQNTSTGLCVHQPSVLTHVDGQCDWQGTILELLMKANMAVRRRLGISWTSTWLTASTIIFRLK